MIYYGLVLFCLNMQLLHVKSQFSKSFSDFNSTQICGTTYYAIFVTSCLHLDYRLWNFHRRIIHSCDLFVIFIIVISSRYLSHSCNVSFMVTCLFCCYLEAACFYFTLSSIGNYSMLKDY